MKEELKKKAIALRRKGHSIKEVAKIVDVARSTVSLWVRNVILNNEAKAEIKKRSDDARVKGQITNHNKKLKRLSIINDKVSLDLKKIKVSKSSEKLLCAMIYYCEGAKDDSALYFANSDPELLRLFIKLLRSCFKIDESKFKVIVHIHQYHNWSKQRKYWSNLLKISEASFYNPYLKKNTGKNKKAGYPGCVSLRYYDSNVSRELLAYSRGYFKKYLRD